jgi:WD40 repeat protein
MMQPILLGKHPNVVYSFAFNNDNTLLASGDYTGTVQLWDIKTSTTITSLIGFDLEYDHRPKMIDALAFSPDGARLAVGLSDYHGEYRLRLWDVEARKEYARFACDEISDLDFTEDGTLLICGSGDSLWLRDGQTGEPLAVLEGHRDYIICVALSSDGSLAATGTAYEEGVVRVWDLSFRTLRAIAGRNNGNVEQVWFSPDGKQLYWFGWDGLHRWDVENETELAAWPDIRGDDRTTILDPTCRIVALSDNYTIHLIDLATEEVVKKLPDGIDEAIITIAFSSDGKMLAIGDGHDRVFLWHIEELG